MPSDISIKFKGPAGSQKVAFSLATVQGKASNMQEVPGTSGAVRNLHVRGKKRNIMPLWSPSSCHEDGPCMSPAAPQPLLWLSREEQRGTEISREEQRGPRCSANAGINSHCWSRPRLGAELRAAFLSSLLPGVIWFVSGPWHKTCFFRTLNILTQDNLTPCVLLAVLSETKKAFWKTASAQQHDWSGGTVVRKGLMSLNSCLPQTNLCSCYSLPRF